jgi:hypothetical protein
MDDTTAFVERQNLNRFRSELEKGVGNGPVRSLLLNLFLEQEKRFGMGWEQLARVDRHIARLRTIIAGQVALVDRLKSKRPLHRSGRNGARHAQRHDAGAPIVPAHHHRCDCGLSERATTRAEAPRNCSTLMASSRHSAAFMVNSWASTVRPSSCASRARAKKPAAWLRNLFVGMTIAPSFALANFEPLIDNLAGRSTRHCASGARVSRTRFGAIQSPTGSRKRLYKRAAPLPSSAIRQYKRKSTQKLERHLSPGLNPFAPARDGPGGVVRNDFFQPRWCRDASFALRGPDA